MTREEIIGAIREDLPFLKQQYGVRMIGLFGSYAKNIQQKDSDIDLFIDINEPLARNYFGVWDYLEKRFHRKIDLVRKGTHLREKFLKNIEKEIIYA